METTIQLYRAVGDPETKQRINDELSDKDNYSHSYVLREFLRTIIKDVAYVYMAVQTVGTAGDGRVALENLDRFLASGRGNFSGMAARRERYVTAAILEHFNETRISSKELLRFLEMTAQQWIKDFFEAPLSDGGTYRIEEERFLTGLDEQPDELERWIFNHRPIPPPPPFPAGAAQFLHKHRHLVRRVEEFVQAASMREQDQNLLKILERLKDKDGRYDFLGKLKPNTRGNWALGDLLIALETPSDVHIYTTDQHYNVLCQALGKRRYQGYLPHRDESSK
ncbi:hypothetical protein HYR99_03330 [Candidatus Poribacteria bacterium]|nr:hypothetical protein [Candidatus Poribacteria bacterium]